MAGIGLRKFPHSLRLTIGRSPTAGGTTIPITILPAVDTQPGLMPKTLQAFIRALHFGKVVVVGHSYGAYAALFLAAEHPQMVRALVLAEPPAISLLKHLPGEEAKTRKGMFEDIQHGMVEPMRQEAMVMPSLEYSPTTCSIILTHGIKCQSRHEMRHCGDADEWGGM